MSHQHQVTAVWLVRTEADAAQLVDGLAQQGIAYASHSPATDHSADPDTLSGLLRGMARRAGSYRRAYQLTARDPGCTLGGPLVVDNVTVHTDSALTRFGSYGYGKWPTQDPTSPQPSAAVQTTTAPDGPLLGDDLVDTVTRLLGPVYGQDPDDLHGGHADALREFMQRNAHQVIARLAELGLQITRSQT